MRDYESRTGFCKWPNLMAPRRVAALIHAAVPVEQSREATIVEGRLPLDNLFRPLVVFRPVEVKKEVFRSSQAGEVFEIHVTCFELVQ